MTSPIDPANLSRVMAIVDTLDQPELAPPLREQLIQSTQAVCQNQGLRVTEEAIEAAVDQNLALGTTTTVGEDTTAYDWKRPRSMAALLAERARLNRGWRRWYRPATDTPAQVAGTLFYMVVAAILTSLFICEWFTTTPMTGGRWLTAAGPLALLLMATLGVRDQGRARALEQPGDTIPFDEWYAWKQRRFVRGMIRDCFRSPLGMVLNGDVTAIRRVVTQADRAWEAQKQAREQAHMQTTLLEVAEHDA